MCSVSIFHPSPHSVEVLSHESAGLTSFRTGIFIHVKGLASFIADWAQHAFRSETNEVFYHCLCILGACVPLKCFNCQRFEVIPGKPLVFREGFIDSLCYFYGGHHFAAVSVINLRQFADKGLWLDFGPTLPRFRRDAELPLPADPGHDSQNTPHRLNPAGHSCLSR